MPFILSYSKRLEVSTCRINILSNMYIHYANILKIDKKYDNEVLCFYRNHNPRQKYEKVVTSVDIHVPV